MKLQKKLKLEKILLRASMVTAIIGIALLIVGIVASLWGLDVLGVFLFLVGVTLAIYEVPEISNCKKCVSANDIILSRDCISEQELANLLSINEKQARELIDQCFRKGNVDGYVRVGQKVYRQEKYVAEKQAEGKIIKAINCPNCGASIKGVVGEPTECPYCRTYTNL